MRGWKEKDDEMKDGVDEKMEGKRNESKDGVDKRMEGKIR